jgi:hypothetical protein
MTAVGREHAQLVLKQTTYESLESQSRLAACSGLCVNVLAAEARRLRVAHQLEAGSRPVHRPPVGLPARYLTLPQGYSNHTGS